MSPRHNTRPGGGANRTGGVAVIKSHARIGKSIDIWGFVESGAVSTKIHHPHVINQKEEEINRLLCKSSEGEEKNRKGKLPHLSTIGS